MTIFQRLQVRTASKVFNGNTFQNTKRFGQRKFSNIYETVRSPGNSGLRYLGAAGAAGLGLYVAYGATRPASFVPSQTRDYMSHIGGSTFATMVRSRIAKTYGYLTASIAITGVTTFLLLSRGLGFRIMSMQMNNPLMFTFGTIGALYLCMGGTMAIDYNRNTLLKHGLWAGVNGLMGMTLLSLTAMAGGAIVQQAALITGCIIGSMSIAAMVSPSDYFLNMGPYLGVGLGVVIAASLGGMFFPGSTMLMNISLYGGLGLFSLYAAYDSQRVLHDAQTREEFDPINEQMGLYMDSINIFIRVVQILMMSQNRRK